MSDVRIPTREELERIMRRGVAEIVPEPEFVEQINSGRKLRLKMGFDPTRPVITLGWAVGLRKLRQLQDLGHTVVVIIGDWTAQIGDPSGQSQTRPMLTKEEVDGNVDAILRQFYRFLDEGRTEIRRQSEWFNDFSLADVVRLAGRFTVAQMLERDDFSQRFASHRPIAIHEFIYPLLQGYDSIAIEADVEFGGSDQKFNNLVGRELQSQVGQRPQSVFLVPLLVGLDGEKKMSQSLGNYVAIDAEPNDMYGKLMSMPDHVMAQYFELLTDVPDEELTDIENGLKERSINPMEVKMRLARDIVSQFHSAEAARQSEEEFVRTFRRRELPEEVPPLAVKLEDGASRVDITGLLAEMGVVGSRSAAKRLLNQRAIEIDGKTIEEPQVELHAGEILRVGKHRFLRVVAAQ